MADESLEKMLERLNIPADKWDLLLIGDGSGSKWGQSIGWGCVAIRRNEMARRVYYGGADNGTVNIAEALAYLIPLSQFAAELHTQEEVDKRVPPPQHVHIVTDSQYIRNRGERKGSIDFHKHAVLWLAFEIFPRQGINLHWHWIEREDVALNHYVDVLSKEARVATQQARLRDSLLSVHGLDVTKCNPWE